MGSGVYNPSIMAARVKRLRNAAGMSIKELAMKANVNKNTICYVEKGESKTTLDTAFKIASALNISINQLVEPKALEDIDFKVVRYKKGARKERKNISISPTYRIGDIDVHLHGGSILGGVIEVFSEGKKELSYHDGEEILFCLTGKIMLNIGGEDVVLEKGDGVVFWGNQPHNYVCVREDGPEKVSVGLSVISGSKYSSLEDLHNNLKKVSRS